jgi:hypothetical protein
VFDFGRREVRNLHVPEVEKRKITINVGLVDLGQIDLLVDEGFYANRTDFIRTAIARQPALGARRPYPLRRHHRAGVTPDADEVHVVREGGVDQPLARVHDAVLFRMTGTVRRDCAGAWLGRRPPRSAPARGSDPAPTGCTRRRDGHAGLPRPHR